MYSEVALFITVDGNLLNDNLLRGGGTINTDINGRPQLAALNNGFVNRVLQEVSDSLRINRLAIIDRGVGELVEDVIEARSPFPGASLGGERAVVNHERNPTVVHVGAKRVDGLNDGLVHDLRVGVSSLPEDITLGHHGGDVDSSCEWVNRNVLLLPIGTDTLSNLPGVGSINLADGVAVKAIAVHNNGADLVAGGDLVVDLLKDLLGGKVGSRVGLLKDILILALKRLIDSFDTLLGDGLDNVASDGLGRFDKGLLRRHALALVAAVKGLDDTMDSTEKNATLSINIRLVLGAKGGLEHERRAEGNAPAEGQVCGLTGLVLVDTEGSVDSGAVDLLALLVKATDGGSHTLGADSDDIHILREGLAD